MEEQNEKLSWLLGAARRIAGDAQLPVPITEVLERFHLGLHIEVQGAGKPGRDTLREQDGRYIVTLKRRDRDSALSSHELFTLAHELGHALLIQKLGWRPQTRREFFECEMLCDKFASHLLVPDNYIIRFKATSAKAIASFARAIALKTGVSLEVSARRLVETYTGLAFLSARSDVNAKGSPVWLVLWGNSSIPELNIQRRKHILVESEIGQYLRDVSEFWKLVDTQNDHKLANGLTGFAKRQHNGTTFAAFHSSVKENATPMSSGCV